MVQARFIIHSPGQASQEELICDGASIGEGPENTIQVRGLGVAAYHLSIEKRNDEFWLCEMGGADGTTVNGAPVTGERRLADGDRLRLGGGTEIEVQLLGRPDARNAVESRIMKPADGGLASITAAPASNNSIVRLMVTILLVVLALSVVIAMMVSRPDCRGEIKIVSLQDGATIRGRLLVKAAWNGCVRRVVWRLDQQVIAHGEEFWLDPAQLGMRMPNLVGGTHQLRVLSQDESGREKSAASVTVRFAEEVRDVVELREMLERFAQKVAPRQQFDDGFVVEVGRRLNHTVELVEPVARAGHGICRTFYTQGLPPQLGPALALSRSRLAAESLMPDEEWERYSFWRLPRRLLRGRLKQHEAEESLRDPVRAAELTGDYLKRLQEGLQRNLPAEDRDFTYSVACFGMDPDVARERIAARWSASGEEYHNFWLMRDRFSSNLPPGASEGVVEFFAAGVVIGNLARFNLPVPPLDEDCGY